MKKRIAVLSCALLLMVGAMAMTATAEGTNLRYECQHCEKVVDWEPVIFGEHKLAEGETAVHLHYYLDQDYSGSAVRQLAVQTGVTVCLDLHGQSITSSNRVIYSGKGGVTVSLMDSVGTGSITVNPTASSNNIAGGVMYADTNATLNIYGGTYTLGDNSSKRTTTGGVVAVQNGAVCNIYGGTVNGGTVGKTGGAIHLYQGGSLHANGGGVNAGTAGIAGNCVYAAGENSRVTLSGNANIGEIFYAYNKSGLTVSGTYTGAADIKYDTDNVNLVGNVVIGSCAGADISDAAVRGTNDGGYYIYASGDSLILSAFQEGTVAAVYSTAGNTGYETLQAAIDAYADGYVALLQDETKPVVVSKDICLEMNGNSVTGTVTVEDGCVLYGMDSETNDYSVADGVYGKLMQVVCQGSGKVTGVTVGSTHAADGYLKVEEDAGISFHRVGLRIYAMTLRAEEVGLYYKSSFAGDELVARNVDKFGVALNAAAVPTAENMETTTQYSWFTGFEAGEVANLGNTNSTLLKDILKTTNEKVINRINADTLVYGRAYILTNDGEYLFGRTVARSLMDQLESVDAMWNSLSQTQTEAVLNMYKKFSYMMKTWDLPNIQQENQTAEDATLKVLVLGNSHGLDATNLLYEVFRDQDPDQKVVLGALYYSGCNMGQHASFVTNNSPVYSYHKNYGQNTDRSWDVVYNTTVLHALEDEQWDIIVMQQMNHRAARDSDYSAVKFKTVIEYLKEHQDYAPRLAWHMVWTNPDQEEYFDASSGLAHPHTPDNWRATHAEWFPGTDGRYAQSVMYDEIIRCTQKYIVDDTGFLGSDVYSFIIPSATAVEYAQDVLGRTQAEIYRDYTHMSDYGRLMVAYLWYAQIMGETSISTVGIDAIPSVLHEGDSAFPTKDSGYAITEEMKADIIAAVNWALTNPFALPEA